MNTCFVEVVAEEGGAPQLTLKVGNVTYEGGKYQIMGPSGEWFPCVRFKGLSSLGALIFYLTHVNPQPEYRVNQVSVEEGVASIKFEHNGNFLRAKCPWDLEVANPLEDTFNAMQRVAQVAV